MLKTIRKNYRRLVAFMLTVAMTLTNVGTNLSVAFAAGEEEQALFLLDGSDLQAAVQDALENGDPFDFGSLELTAKNKSLKSEYQKLIGGTNGTVYELDADIDGSYAPENTDLRVFYNAKTEQVVFLFINESDMTVSFRANVDGYETERLTVRPNEANVDEEDLGAAEDSSDGMTEDDQNETTGAEAAGPGEESADETETSEETEAETEAAVEEETEAAAEEETEAAVEEETEAAAEEETEAAAEEETEAAVEEETEAAAEPETEAAADTEEPEVTVGRSAHYAARVASSVIVIEPEEVPMANEPETEVSVEVEVVEDAEKETEAAIETETEAAVEAETTAAPETEETLPVSSEGQEDATEAAPELDPTETLPEADDETEAAGPGENIPEEPTADLPSEEIPSAEEPTADQPSESAPAVDVPETDAPAADEPVVDEPVTGDEGQLLEDDINGTIPMEGELSGKALGTVTIWGSANARAFRVALSDLPAAEIPEDSYLVDYSVDPIGAAEIQGSDTIVAGGDLYFAVKPQDGYELTGVTANGAELTLADRASVASASDLGGYEYVYVVTGVEEDLEIVASLEPTAQTGRFQKSVTLDGVTVTVTADTDAIPADAELEVTEVTGQVADAVTSQMLAEADEETEITAVMAYHIQLTANGQVLDSSLATVEFSGEKIEETSQGASLVEVVSLDAMAAQPALMSLDEESAENAPEAEVETLASVEVDPENGIADVSFEKGTASTFAYVAAKAKAKSYKLYTYTLIPGIDLGADVTSDLKWNGMGVGWISGVPTPGSLPGSTKFKLDKDGMKITYPYTAPYGYPDIKIDEEIYHYAETDSDNASKEGYYTIEWLYVISSAGANAGNNEFNETADANTRTYHLDGRLDYNEKGKSTVSFWIQQPGETNFEFQQKYYVKVKNGFPESKLNRPGTSDKWDDQLYTFDGWYLDEDCTKKATFTGTITENTNYYGKYVPKETPDELRYDANGGRGTMKLSEGYAGKTVKVKENEFTLPGYEFVGWNTVRKYTTVGTWYQPGEDYTLRKWQDDVLYAQWKELDDVTITYTAEAGGSVTKQSETLNPETGTAKGSTAKPDTGYQFDGWYVGDKRVSGDITLTKSVINQYAKKDGRYTATTFTAKFKASTAEYTVEHYQQNIADDGYTKKDTETKRGTTGTTASFEPKNYRGFTWKPDKTEQSDLVIMGDGNLVIRLYYDRETYEVSYQYTGTVPTNAPGLPGTDTYRYGATVTAAKEAHLQGYTFDGWYLGSRKTTTFTMPNHDVVLTGSFTANEAGYKVEYYTENLDGSTYSVRDTRNFTGTTGIEVVAKELEFEGFTFDPDHKDTKQTGIVTGDGQLVLKLYYSRNSYEVTYAYDNNVPGATPLPNGGNYKFGETVSVAPNASAAGYTFSGWKKDGGVVSDSFEMPAKNVTLTGSFEANEDTGYRVEHYIENLDGTYQVATLEYESGVTGAEVTAEPQSYEGFTFDNTVSGTKLTGTITGDGQLVLKLYYTRNKYWVSYQYDAPIPEGAISLPATKPYKYGEMVSVGQAADVAGYTFSGWKNNGESVGTGFEMPAEDVKLRGSYTARTDTAYTVNHYLEKLDGTGYERAASDSFAGETGKVVTASPQTFKGFTFDEDAEGTKLTGIITGDGKLELNLYYTRNSYLVSYQYDGTVPDGVPSLPTTKQYKYQEEVTVADAVEVPGYIFLGWKRGGNSETSFVMPDHDVVLTGSFGARNDTRYVVEHYQQNLDGKGYTRKDTDEKKGTTGAAVQAKERKYTGFTFNPAVEGTITEGTIAADGSLVLKLYYDRNEYTVTYEYVGYEPEDATPLPEAKTYRYGERVTIADPATAAGYTFIGWKRLALSARDFDMPANDVTIWGSFVANWNTKYTVNHYLETVDGDYELREQDSEERHGVTGTLVSAHPNVYQGFTYDRDNPDKVVSGVIKGDGSLELRFYYKRNTYNVIYQYEGEVPDNASQLPETKAYKFAEMVELEDDAVAEGYTFSGWMYSGVPAKDFTMPLGDVVLTGSFTPNTDTKYTVEHWLEALDGEYNREESETFTGTTGERVSAAENEYAGFYFDSTVDGTLASGNIEPDGSLVLRLYYKRQTYSVTYEYKGFVPEKATALPDTRTYKYQEWVEAAPPAGAPGYTFSGWSETGKFLMPAENVHIIGSFTENEPVAILYRTADSTMGTVNPESESVAPATGIASGSNAEALPGYHFTHWTVKEEPANAWEKFVDLFTGDELVIEGAGPELTGEVVDLYAKESGLYKTRVFTAYFAEDDAVTIRYVADGNGKVTNAAETLNPATGEAKGSVAEADDGYKFTHWTNSAGETVSESASFVPEKNGAYEADTYTAHFSKRGDLAYAVNYYYDEVKADDESVLKDDAVFGETIPYHEIPQRDGYTFDRKEVGSETVTTDDAKNVINVYFAKDVIGTEDPDQGDQIPDKYQITFTYASGPNGSVTGTLKEVVTREKNADGSYSETNPAYPKGDVVASGNNRYRVRNWTFGENVYASLDVIRQTGFTSDADFTVNWYRTGGGGGGGGSTGGPSGGGSTSPGGPGTVTIGPGEVPLAVLPENANGDGTVSIDEEEVPLAALPKTGRTSANGLMLLFSSMMLAAMVITGRKKEEK